MILQKYPNIGKTTVNIRHLLLGRVVARAAFYEGEGGPNPAGGTGGNPTPEPTPTPTPTPTPAPNPQPPAGFVSQDVVNRLLKQAEDKARQEKQKMLNDLEALRQSANLTEQDKNNLTTRIEELQASLQTKEQQAQSEMQKLQKKYELDTTKFREEGDRWKARYEEKLKSVDIAVAAEEHKAYSAEQIDAILRPMTQVVDEMDEQNKPTGNFVTKVNFLGEDKEGKPVKLVLSPKAAVKAMSEMAKYANLFHNPSNGGIGAQPSSGGNGSRLPNIDNMTPEQYRANRAAIRANVAKGA